MTELLLGTAIITLIYQGVKLSKAVKQVIDIEIVTNRNEEMLNRRIDQEIDRNNNLHRETIQYVDSRLVKDKSKKKILKG